MGLDKFLLQQPMRSMSVRFLTHQESEKHTGILSSLILLSPPFEELEDPLDELLLPPEELVDLLCLPMTKTPIGIRMAASRRISPSIIPK